MTKGNAMKKRIILMALCAAATVQQVAIATKVLPGTPEADLALRGQLIKGSPTAAYAWDMIDGSPTLVIGSPTDYASGAQDTVGRLSLPEMLTDIEIFLNSPEGQRSLQERVQEIKKRWFGEGNMYGSEENVLAAIAAIVSKEQENNKWIKALKLTGNESIVQECQKNIAHMMMTKELRLTDPWEGSRQIVAMHQCLRAALDKIATEFSEPKNEEQPAAQERKMNDESQSRYDYLDSIQNTFGG